MTKLGDVVGGKYLLEHVIGVGGMGTVFQASHKLLGKKVAIKLLRHEFASQPVEVERFYREAQAAASLGHRGIAEVHDVGWTDDGVPFMVMALLEGETLAEHLRSQGGRIDPARAVALCDEILSALIKVHRAGVVHRDLKPSNLFIAHEDDDGPPQLKILDFGISKITVDAANHALTQEGAILGTPWYMAPEQARGDADVDQRADLWAVGAILYEALTGRRPFTGENFRQICFNIVSDLPVRPTRIRPELAPDLERIVLTALTKDRDARYQEAEQFLDDLRSVRLDATPPARGGVIGSMVTEVEKMEVLDFDGEDTPTNELETTPAAEACAADMPKTVVLPAVEESRIERSESIRRRVAPESAAKAEPVPDTFTAAVNEERRGPRRRGVILVVALAGALLLVVVAVAGASLLRASHREPAEPAHVVVTAVTPSAPPPTPARRESVIASEPAGADPLEATDTAAEPEIAEPSGLPDEVVVPLPEPAIQPEPLTPEEVAVTLRELDPEVRSCVAGLSRRHSTLLVSITVSPRGQVALVETSPRLDESATSCLSELLADHPQRATGGGPLELTHRYVVGPRSQPRGRQGRDREGSDLRDNPFGTY